MLFRDSTEQLVHRGGRSWPTQTKRLGARRDGRGTPPAALHRYRSHTCGALRKGDVGATARLSGWVHRVRDHGGLLFIDLRDHYGLTQVVADPDSPAFKTPRRCARSG